MQYTKSPAEKLWQEYTASRNKYKKRKNAATNIVRELIVNISKIVGDAIQKYYDRKLKLVFKNFFIKIIVQARNDLYEDPYFLEIRKINSNRAILSNLAEEELYTEILARHFLRIEGISIEHFRHLMRLLGGNPWAFLSGDRKENGGRLVIDNKYLEAIHPFISTTNPIWKIENKYWQKIFPNSPSWVFWNKWYMSRTHAPIYVIKNQKGSDVILLPIHIDPKNGMTIFKRRELGEKSIWAYHQVGQQIHNRYVGTGLCDLGCKYFIYLMKYAERKGFVRQVDVLGEEKLETTGSIVLDDKFTDEVIKLA